MTDHTFATGSDNDTDHRSGKYLTFSLDNEEYGISILKIKEITQMLPITPVPHTPPFVMGVVNLRGKVIPVIDLRTKFTMEAIDYTDRTCMIVVEIDDDGEMLLVGNIVDSVTEVLNVKDNEIEDSPAFGTSVETEFILGMANVEGGVKILLDIDMVANINEIQVSEELLEQ